MSNSTELNTAIVRMINIQKEFIQTLRNLKIKTKEQIILDHYQNIISSKYPWLTTAINPQQIEKPDQKSTGIIDINLNVTQLIENIEKNPKKKKELITYFLMDFNQINENDRQVLSDNFSNLALDQLKKELLDLCGMFSACE